MTSAPQQRYALERDFGLKRANFELKLDNDLPKTAEWRQKAKALLSRAEDAYNLEEVELLSEIIYTEVDRSVVREPDGYTVLMFRVASGNRVLHEKVQEQIRNIRARADGAAPELFEAKRDQTLSAVEVLSLGGDTHSTGIVLESINSSRVRVLQNGTELGYIWRTRIKVEKVGEHLPGWVHSRSGELFIGPRSKDAAINDLKRMADTGLSARTKNPMWLTRLLNLGELDRPAVRRAPASPRANGETPTGPVWRIGLFRNAKGKLSTAYVNAEGTPLPYERRRVGDRKIVFHKAYTGMKYSEARVQLVADAEAAGVQAVE